MSQPSYYFELWVQISTHDEDLWSVFCFEQGASGIETLEETSSHLTLRVFFEQISQSIIEKLPHEFHITYPHTSCIQFLKLEKCPYQDWRTSWYIYFKPIDVGHRLTICPPWHREEISDTRIPIVINPGQGFGTGNHPSTLLALETLEEHLNQRSPPPEKMLDVGTGSGILAFAACHLGVSFVHAVDIDMEAINDVISNSQLNDTTSKITVQTEPLSILNEPYPLVISNMLLKELLEVRHDLARLTSSTGVLICSGFIKKQEVELFSAFASLHMKPVYSRYHEEWGSVMFHHATEYARVG